MRSALYDEFGDELVNDFAAIAARLEKRLAEWGNDDLEEDSDDGEAKKGLPEKKKKKLLDASTWADDAQLVATANGLRQELGGDVFEDYNHFRDRVDDALRKLGLKLSASDLKTILRAVSWRVETAPPVIAKIHKPGKMKADALRGFYDAKVNGKSAIVEYEPDPDLRDTEQISFLEAPPSGLPGGLPSEASAKEGIEAFIRREVLPYTPDAWIKEGATKIGYEVSFTRHFYQPPQLRTLAQISADILALEQETEGLLQEITKGVAR